MLKNENMFHIIMKEFFFYKWRRYGGDIFDVIFIFVLSEFNFIFLMIKIEKCNMTVCTWKLYTKFNFVFSSFSAKMNYFMIKKMKMTMIFQFFIFFASSTKKNIRTRWYNNRRQCAGRIVVRLDLDQCGIILFICHGF